MSDFTVATGIRAHLENMFTALFVVLTAFAAGTNWLSRRTGRTPIARRPYGNVYSDATGARRSS